MAAAAAATVSPSCASRAEGVVVGVGTGAANLPGRRRGSCAGAALRWHCAWLPASCLHGRRRRRPRWRDALQLPSGLVVGSTSVVGDVAEDGGVRRAPKFSECSPAEQRRLLLAAAKPPMYSVAVAPVAAGVAAAWAAAPAMTPFPWPAFSALAGGAVLVILWLNLSNDAFDAMTGVDENKRESVVNITGSMWGTLAASFASLAAGIALIASQVRNQTSMALLAGAIACGYVYQSPPFRLGYLGLGEPLCFISFGPMATLAFYMATLRAISTPAAAAADIISIISPGAVIASLIVGITTTAILFCSHFHQIDDDRAAGKLSPIVRLGTKRAAGLLPWAAGGVYTSVVVGMFSGALPVPALALFALTLPIVNKMLRFVSANHADPSVVFKAKYFAVRWHAAVTLALALSLAAPKLLMR
eukprot:jgi/Chlat1/7225/Chrsp57S06861